MHREITCFARRSRPFVVLLLALAMVAVFGTAAQRALAAGDGSFDHGGASCSSCHTAKPRSAANASSDLCITCHTGYVLPDATKTCWTCHTPGQSMAAVKTGAPAVCTTVCHLASGTDNTHVAHVPDRGPCTDCHNLTTSDTVANGSPHHSVPVAAPVATTVTLKVAPASIKLKKTVKASGVVTPIADLAGKKVVAIRADRKVGTKWVKTTTGSVTVSPTGTYTWTYKPLKKGSYRVKASIAATATYEYSATVYKTFKVK